jgi:hypothetical protein
MNNKNRDAINLPSLRLPNGKRNKSPLVEKNAPGKRKGRLIEHERDRKKNSGPGEKSVSTYLVEETRAMDRKRRLMEQDGERRIAKVQAREHPDTEVNNGPEEAAQNGMLQHPELDNQRFDGVDPNLNPDPPLNSEARREFDNEKREQEMEKQLRLGNTLKYSSAPVPRGP